MFTFGVPLHGKSPYVKSLLLVEKKQDFVIRANHLILILKFPNQNQMILSCDFRKILEKFSNQNQMIFSEDFRKNKSFDSDFIFKNFKK